MRLADAALAARIARAAEALAASRTADERLIEIRLRGAAAAREVGFTYVAGAPLWKPSWRLVLPAGEGEARLQGWAVVENRSGADWDEVRLSLVSGNPAAYRQALYAPIRITRPELPVRVAEQVTVTADTGRRPAPPPPMAMAAPAPAAMARQGRRRRRPKRPGAASPIRSRRCRPPPPPPQPGASPSPCRHRFRCAAGRRRTCPSWMPPCRPSGSGGCRISRRAAR
ncbi:DUF4139 domain-containing protein [Siccirubricoccus deserti]